MEKTNARECLAESAKQHILKSYMMSLRDLSEDDATNAVLDAMKMIMMENFDPVI